MKRIPYGGCDCSLGKVQCDCFQACQKPEPDIDPPITLADFVVAAVMVAALALALFAGPWASDVRVYVAGWL